MGKSTFARNYFSKYPYINGDEIKRQAELSGQQFDIHSLRLTVQDRINNHVQRKESFAFESNLVSNYSFDIVQDLSAKGYQTYLYYIGASDLKILNARIDQRVSEGLHYVSPAEVKQRYEEALKKLPSNLKHFDKVSFLDNSVQGIEPSEVLKMERGVIKWISAETPTWLAQILPSIQRLSGAYEKLSGKKQQPNPGRFFDP